MSGFAIDGHIYEIVVIEAMLQHTKQSNGIRAHEAYISGRIFYMCTQYGW